MAGGIRAVAWLWQGASRVDVLTRYLLDPFREVPWGLSLGGGVTIPYVDGDTRVRPYLTLVVDVESSFYFHREGNGVLMGIGGRHERASFDTSVDHRLAE